MELATLLINEYNTPNIQLKSKELNYQVLKTNQYDLTIENTHQFFKADAEDYQSITIFTLDKVYTFYNVHILNKEEYETILYLTLTANKAEVIDCIAGR